MGISVISQHVRHKILVNQEHYVTMCLQCFNTVGWVTERAYMNCKNSAPSIPKTLFMDLGQPKVTLEKWPVEQRK